MKILSISVYFYLFLSILFGYSKQGIASKKTAVQEAETFTLPVEEKKQAVVKIYKPNVGQGSGFFIGDNKTLVINAHMLDIFATYFNTEALSTSRTASHVKSGTEKKSNIDLLPFPITPHLKTITIIHEGNILNLEIKGVAVSGKDNIAVLKVEGYTGPFLKVSKSPVHKNNELYVIGFPFEDFTIIKGRNIFQKHRPRQMTIAGNKLTSNGINGSPVFNREGVVGIVTESFSNFIFASKVQHLTPLLMEDSLRNTNPDTAAQKVTEEIKQLHRKAEQGDTWAQYMIGMGIKYKADNLDEAHAHKEYKKASFRFQRAANRGLSPAQLQMGLLLYFGLGLPSDKKEAALSFQKAAQDSAIAQLLFGLMLYNGIGIAQNIQYALFLFQKAAEQGLLLAQLQLFEIFKNDNSDPANKKKAEFWFQEARKQNVTLARDGEAAIPEIIAQSRLVHVIPSRCQRGFRK